MRERITYILMTCDRPGYLERALHFYRHHGIRLHVCDASAESRSEMVARAGGESATYHHRPGARLHERILEMLDAVTTPYVRFLTDDDFFLPEAMEDLADHLDAHPDCVAAAGVTVQYQEVGGDLHYFVMEHWTIGHDVDGEDPIDRIRAMWTRRAGMSQYALFRTGTIRRNQCISLAGDDPFFLSETVTLSLLAAAGRIAFLNVPFVFQERPDHASLSAKVVTIDRMLDDPRYEAVLRDYRIRLESIAHLYPSKICPEPKMYAGAVFDAVTSWYTTTIHLPSWGPWPLLRTRWKSRTDRPELLFEPIQHLEVAVYNPKFAAILEEIDLRIRIAGLRDGGVSAKLDDYSRQAARMLDQGREDEALQVLEEIHSVSPFHGPSVERLLRIQRRRGDAAEVVRLSAWLDRLRDAGLSRSEDPGAPGAPAPASAASPAEPGADDLGAILEKADASFRAGHLDEALSLLLGAEQRSPMSLQVVNAKAWILVKMERLSEAHAQYIKATQLWPDDPSTHANLAGIRLQLGQPDRAEAPLLRVLEMRPGDPDALVALARIYRSRGEDAAADRLEREHGTAAKDAASGAPEPSAPAGGTHKAHHDRDNDQVNRLLGRLAEAPYDATTLGALVEELTSEERLLEAAVQGCRLDEILGRKEAGDV